jgi:glycosyltransferase involved in cell wall biosynthesis
MNQPDLNQKQAQGNELPFGRSLLVDLSHHAGGATTRTLDLLKALPRGLASLAVIEGSAAALAAKRAGLSIHVLARHKGTPALGFRLRQLVAEEGYGIVDSQNAQSQFWVAMARLPATTARVSTLNSWYQDEYRASLRGLFYHRIVHHTRRSTDGYIVVAPTIRDRLLNCAVPANQISVIPAAVGVDATTVPDVRTTWWQSLGLQDGEQLLCSIGRLVDAKNYPCLIRAMAHLADYIHLAIVGGGPLRDDLVDAVDQARLSSRIHFLGTLPHEDTLGLLRAADACVLASTTEGTPVALLEAAALEKPIVATRVGGIPALFPSPDLATLVTPEDDHALAEALQTVLSDPGAAHRMGQRAASHVQTAHGMQAMVQATLAAYAEAWKHRNEGRTAC